MKKKDMWKALDNAASKNDADRLEALIDEIVENEMGDALIERGEYLARKMAEYEDI